eukprot:SAG11_NODE_4446_length_1891_cov_15.168527_2_plen_159_part_00
MRVLYLDPIVQLYRIRIDLIVSLCECDTRVTTAVPTDGGGDGRAGREEGGDAGDGAGDNDTTELDTDEDTDDDNDTGGGCGGGHGGGRGGGGAGGGGARKCKAEEESWIDDDELDWPAMLTHIKNAKTAGALPGKRAAVPDEQYQDIDEEEIIGEAIY